MWHVCSNKSHFAICFLSCKDDLGHTHKLPYGYFLYTSCPLTIGNKLCSIVPDHPHTWLLCSIASFLAKNLSLWVRLPFVFLASFGSPYFTWTLLVFWQTWLSKSHICAFCIQMQNSKWCTNFGGALLCLLEHFLVSRFWPWKTNLSFSVLLCHHEKCWGFGLFEPCFLWEWVISLPIFGLNS
jgi:hypothetical protein